MAKRITVGLLAILGLSFYGLIDRLNFMASPLLESIWLPIATPLVIGGMICMAKDRHPKNRLNDFGPIRWVLAMAAFAGIWFFLCHAAIALGFPLLITWATGEVRSESATVTRVLRETSWKGCHYRVALSGTIPSATWTPCLSEELWSLLKRRDTVVMRCRTGPLGILIDDIHR